MGESPVQLITEAPLFLQPDDCEVNCLKILRSRVFWALIAFGLAVAVSYAVAKSNDNAPSTAAKEEMKTAIEKPACDLVLHPTQPKDDCYYKEPQKAKVSVATIKETEIIKIPVSGTDLKSPSPIDAEKLKVFLQHSPLAAHTEQIVKSDFASLIIGICWIEQHKCASAPYNNYWGMMKAGGESAGLRHFASLPEAISYMDAYFTKLYTRAVNPKQTVQSLRGYYCASACTTWEPTVLKIKNQIESL